MFWFLIVSLVCSTLGIFGRAVMLSVITYPRVEERQPFDDVLSLIESCVFFGWALYLLLSGD